MLRSTRGTWTGTAPIDYIFRWFRCDGRGAADASDCARITNASNTSYVLRQATPASGSARRYGDECRRPGHGNVEPDERRYCSQARQHDGAVDLGLGGCRHVLKANRGQWAGDDRSPTRSCGFAVTTRATTAARSRAQTTPSYEVRDADTGGRSASASSPGTTVARRLRSRTRPASSARTSLRRRRPGALPVGDLKAAGDRLVIASVQFSPNPVTSRTAPITVRVRVTARGGRPVNGALVFMRGTPRVVQVRPRQRRPTAS